MKLDSTEPLLFWYISYTWVVCGIAGFVHKNACDARCSSLEFEVHKLQGCRGPDSIGSSTGSLGENTIHLFHQRLKVQDLSDLANQPLVSRKKRGSSLVFNGEIYNVTEVKTRFLSGFKTKTKSDTEILLESLTVNQLTPVLQFVRGMFAFALVDADKGELTLARDRFGEKPLHFSMEHGRVFFSSQYDSCIVFRKLFGSNIDFDQYSIHKYLTFGYFPYNSSLVKGIEKVPPGGVVSIAFPRSELPIRRDYRWIEKWSARQSENIPVEALHITVEKAVTEQLIGDVPIGTFLSGGSDSTLVTAIAQKFANKPLHSFSVGFDIPEFDESQYALRAAQQIGTKHHQLIMNSEDALSTLQQVRQAFPEPLGDPSVLPTAFISRAASSHVTVALTGDGADELFFGYSRYQRFMEIEQGRTLPFFRSLAELLSPLATTLASSLITSRMNRALHALASIDGAWRYCSLIGFPFFDVSSDVHLFRRHQAKLVRELWSRGISEKPANRLREIDIDSYLTDDILVKVDRSAMANGLETRAPFLDARVQSLARVAPEWWLRGIEAKHAVKKVLGEYVSNDIFQRPKMGFGAPISYWLRGSLREWGEFIIKESEWEELGINSSKVRSIYARVQHGHDDGRATFAWMLLLLGDASLRIKS